jgi:xanthine dehydrogenase accessory factor
VIAGVLLAAGESRRMGRPKLLLEVGGRPMVRRVAEALLDAGLEPVVAVLGSEAQRVGEALSGLPLDLVENPAYASGQASSLGAGLRALPPECVAAAVALGDLPGLTRGAVRELVRAFRAGGKGIAVPVHAGRRGHPVLFDLGKYGAELLSLSGDQGGRSLLAAHPDDVLEVEIRHPGVVEDVDTPQEYEKIMRLHSSLTDLKVLIRGAGEQASGIAHRLFRSHLRVAMTEVPEPLAVRRGVSFCEAVWEGGFEVESVRARRVESPRQFGEVIDAGEIPVLVDPELSCLSAWKPDILIDATIAKRNVGIAPGMAPLVIAFGPGFEAGVEVDVVVETNRGHDLGRLYFQGFAESNTGIPGPTMGFSVERVLRAPCEGVFEPLLDIGDPVASGQPVARVGREEIRAEILGVVRGLLRPGIRVQPGLKAGDIDPRADRDLCFTISEKARALGGSALEAILMRFNA